MEQLGGGCFTPLGIYCRSNHLIAEVLSLDGKRTERIEASVQDTEQARNQGRILKGRAQDLIDQARTSLGVTYASR
jgi:hydroxymethylbilane synthase